MTTTETARRRPPPPPPELVKVGRRDGAGRHHWKLIVSKYDLRPDELTILEHACHQLDRIAKLRKAAEGASLTARGSAGQIAIHPYIKELRELENSHAGLMAKLKLPDLPDENQSTGSTENPRSVNARAAAQARWSKTG